MSSKEVSADGMVGGKKGSAERKVDTGKMFSQQQKTKVEVEEGKLQKT